jgi:murein DD-endopeptidase MepM/ murein hydrolase activator NlpD
MKQLKQKLKNHANLANKAISKYKNFSSIISTNFFDKPPFIFDLTENNLELNSAIISDIKKFQEYINKKIENNNSLFGIGLYNEDRTIYRRSKLFAQDEEPRSIHLGIDLWLPAETAIFAPLDGVVHSVQDNASFGDYGPTIILEHNLDGIKFYTLYGHLSRKSLPRIKAGKEITQGERFTKVGNCKENGQWPTHVHFEIITDMLGKSGDFPGVSSLTDQKYYTTVCPDPNLILRLDITEKR